MREKVSSEVGARNTPPSTDPDDSSNTTKAREKTHPSLLPSRGFVPLIFPIFMGLFGVLSRSDLTRGERERKQEKEPSLSLTTSISPLSSLTLLFFLPLPFLVHISFGILARRSLYHLVLSPSSSVAFFYSSFSSSSASDLNLGK